MTEADTRKLFESYNYTHLNGVRVYFDEDGGKYCIFDDYIEARKNKGMKWSEKSFCDWCDKYDIEPVG